jgi:hypothetical protein
MPLNIKISEGRNKYKILIILLIIAYLIYTKYLNQKITIQKSASFLVQSFLLIALQNAPLLIL